MDEYLIRPSDAINAAIEAMDKHCNGYNSFRDMRIRKAIEGVPSAGRPQEWIPCSERLPEEHEWVGTKQFGTTISDIVHITFDVNGERFVKTLSLQNGELSNYEKRHLDAFYKGWKMLAWMPLPEPWEGVDDDGI